MTQDFSLFNNLVTDRVAAHRELLNSKGSDKKYVGYLSNLIPVEMIHAAGMQPIMLCGDPKKSTELADEFMEAAFDPITRSVFNRLLKGDYNFLDLIVLPRANDSYQRLYYYLCELHRKYPEYNIPPVFMLNMLHSGRPSTDKHNNKQFSRFATCLQVIAETGISRAQIEQAIASYNECRKQLHTFNQLRAQHQIPTSLIDAVYATVQCTNVDRVNEALSGLNQAIATKPISDDKPRLVIVGNGVDHSGLHEFIDQLGASVVGDYHFYGQQFLSGLVDTELEALTALQNHYCQAVKSTRTPPPDIDGPISSAKQQRADGILFFFLQGEEALTWQVPKQLAATKAANIPCTVFYDCDYAVSIPELRSQLQTFIQSLNRERA